MNRSTIYKFLRDDERLCTFTTKIGKGKYMVFRIPFKWDTSYLYINNMRITNFESLILFSNELVVRFMMYGECQINIPYSDIESIEIREDEYIGYEKLHKDKRLKYCK